MRSSSWLVRLCQVQDVGLMVQDHVRAPGVVAIYLVDPVTCKEGVQAGEGRSEGTSQEGGASSPAPCRLASNPALFRYTTNFLYSTNWHCLLTHQD